MYVAVTTDDDTNFFVTKEKVLQEIRNKGCSNCTKFFTELL